MKLLDVDQTREEYFERQVSRSCQKYRFCKVSANDVTRYADVIRHHRANIADRRHRSTPARALGPVLCLGTRNGREVDLFRIGFFGSKPHRRLVRLLERRTSGFNSWFATVEGLGRSDFTALHGRSVIGAEINPTGGRRDVWTGPFDDLPDAWESRFGVVYSNAFDHSDDPIKTAHAWKAALRPGGYLILAYTEDAEPTVTDRVGGLSVKDMLTLFPGQLVYFHRRGSRVQYSELIIVPSKPA